MTTEEESQKKELTAICSQFLRDHVADYYPCPSNEKIIYSYMEFHNVAFTRAGLEGAFRTVRSQLFLPRAYATAIRALRTAGLPETVANAEKLAGFASQHGYAETTEACFEALNTIRAELPDKGSEVDMTSAESLSAIREFLDSHTEVFNSPSNRGLILNWLQDRRLQPTTLTLEAALAAVSDQLDRPRRAKPINAVPTTVINELSPEEIAKRQLENQGHRRGLEGALTGANTNRDALARAIARREQINADARARNFSGNR